MQIQKTEHLCQQKLSDLNAILKEPSSPEVKNQCKVNSGPLVVKRSSQIDPEYILKTQESHNREDLFEKNRGLPVFQYLENMTSSFWFIRSGINLPAILLFFTSLKILKRFKCITSCEEVFGLCALTQIFFSICLNHIFRIRLWFVIIVYLNRINSFLDKCIFFILRKWYK